MTVGWRGKAGNSDFLQNLLAPNIFKSFINITQYL